MRNLMKCEIVFSCPRENDAHIRTTSWGFSLGEFTSNVTVINMITYVKYLKQQLGCLVYEGLAVGLDPEGYGNPDFCWISIYDKLIWSFAGPIAIVILVTCSHFLFSHLYIYINIPFQSWMLNTVVSSSVAVVPLSRWMAAFSWLSPRCLVTPLRRRPRSFLSCGYSSMKDSDIFN